MRRSLLVASGLIAFTSAPLVAQTFEGSVVYKFSISGRPTEMLPNDLFEIPAGYTEIKMPAGMRPK